MLVSSISLLYAAGRPVFLVLSTIKGMAVYCRHKDTPSMSVSSGSSTPVMPARSDMDKSDTSDREEKPPTYVLGQKVPDFRTTGPSAINDEILGAEKFEPFVVNVLRSNGTHRNYVGITGEFFMDVNGDLEYVYMIIGSKKVVKAYPWDIWTCKDCTLLYPNGYGSSTRNGKIRFSKTAIMRAYFESLSD